jgi:AcrR family transcriptional regulator
MQEIGDGVVKALASDLTLEDKFFEMVCVSFRYFLEHEDVQKLVHANMSLLRELVPIDQFTEAFAAFLSIPVSSDGGDFAELDSELLFEAMIGVCLEVGMAMIFRGPDSADDAARFVSDLFFGGMLRMRSSGVGLDAGRQLVEAAQRAYAEKVEHTESSGNEDRRERRKGENREAILVAAQQAFAELGYQATGVRDISRRADLSAGTLYNHFSGKHEIFRVLADRYFGEFADQVGYCRENARSLEELVAGQFRCAFEFAVNQPVMFEMINRNQSEIWRMMPRIKNLTRMVTELAVDARAMMDQGMLPVADPDYTVVSILGAGFSIGRIVAQRDAPNVDPGVQFATDLFVGGALKVSGANPTAALEPYERRYVRPA